MVSVRGSGSSSLQRVGRRRASEVPRCLLTVGWCVGLVVSPGRLRCAGGCGSWEWSVQRRALELPSVAWLSFLLPRWWGTASVRGGAEGVCPLKCVEPAYILWGQRLGIICFDRKVFV